MSPARATRVVIADDSALMRTVLADELRRAGIDVVGVAADGDEALTRCAELAPDVLSLDLAMPGRDGVGVLKELRVRKLDIPVVVVSAFSAAAGVRAVDALAEGAFDLVAKPRSRGELDGFARDLVERILLAHSERARRGAPAAPAAPADRARRLAETDARLARGSATAANRVVVIVSSTGGPRALAELLPRLPAPLGSGTLIVQHMPEGFTASLADRLDRASPLRVCEASGNDLIDGGQALIAPGGKHMHVSSTGLISVTDEPPIGGLRPRADITIADAAAVWGERLLLVVLTGMGKDGLAGAGAVRKTGGRILVEAASSCVVHGMPRAVAEAGLADDELDLDDLPEAILAEAAP
jgi:two-component system, chemotaxis family, protein-glutamate methylesterase/glutaminase